LYTASALMGGAVCRRAAKRYPTRVMSSVGVPSIGRHVSYVHSAQ